jgi:hypothetical protein
MKSEVSQGWRRGGCFGAGGGRVSDELPNWTERGHRRGPGPDDANPTEKGR